MENGYSKRWSTGEEMMPGELYRNTAGEIEARDAASRRTLTPEERINKAPDLGDENTIFAEDGKSYSINNTRDMPWKIRCRAISAMMEQSKAAISCISAKAT